MIRQHINLTGRILFCFWITLVLVLLAAGLLFKYDRERQDGHKHSPIPKLGSNLALMLLTKPFSEVKQWFEQHPAKEKKNLFVLYDGQEILGRAIPPRMENIVERLTDDHPFIHKHRRGLIKVGRLLLMPNGKYAKIIIRLKDPHPSWYQIVHDNLIYALMIAILISGLISYALARYISRPIRSLREATKRLASGDLSTRVLPNINQGKDELYLLAQDFDHMAAELDRSINSQKRLIQDISHELRTPVARLQVALALARKRIDLQSSKELDRIENECHQINDIITTLLNLPAYELAPDTALTDMVDIGMLLEVIAEDFNYIEGKPKINYTNKLTDDVILKANTQLLRSAFDNIVKNAQYYSDATLPVKLDIQNTDNNIIIRCRDYGPGIPQSKLQEIFKPFYRISDARERDSGGYGLGLAIAQRSIHLHRGTIHAKNMEPNGLCLEIYLPLNLSH